MKRGRRYGDRRRKGSGSILSWFGQTHTPGAVTHKESSKMESLPMVYPIHLRGIDRSIGGWNIQQGIEGNDLQYEYREDYD